MLIQKNGKYITITQRGAPYNKIYTFKDFCKAHGLFPRIAPNTKREYLSYKYWALAQGGTAYGAEQPDEKLAFQIARKQFLEEGRAEIRELLDSQ